MPLKYTECFGLPSESDGLGEAIKTGRCPFLDEPCSKKFSSGITNGACTLAKETDNVPVICCPKRLYANQYQTLRDVARIAFGDEPHFLLENEQKPTTGKLVIPFGQRQGKEIRISHSDGMSGSKFSVDWILALIDEEENLEEFVAVEVQTIDTTGNYQGQFWDIATKHHPSTVDGQPRPDKSSSSFNYENVNKRILPQLITKGHILRRENLCKKGLFFVCPQPVYERITTRVGELPVYPVQTGSITFLAYQLDLSSGKRAYPLELKTQHTSTTDQLSVAFSSPKNLPEAGVYEEAIRNALIDRL